MANFNLHTMRNPHGNAVIIDPEMSEQERDTFLCCHCGRHRRIKPGLLTDRIGEFCRLCYQFHCDSEDCFICVPFEKKMKAYERRTVLSGQLTKMLL